MFSRRDKRRKGGGKSHRQLLCRLKMSLAFSSRSPYEEVKKKIKKKQLRKQTICTSSFLNSKVTSCERTMRHARELATLNRRDLNRGRRDLHRTSWQQQIWNARG